MKTNLTYLHLLKMAQKDPNSDLIQLENGTVGFKNTDRDVIQFRPFQSSLINMNLQANEFCFPLKCCKFLSPHLMAAEL